MNWYKCLKLADYAAWAEQVEEYASRNPYPFSSWFDENGRTYVPFNAEVVGFDEEVKGMLDAEGCQITDYRGGYCQKGKNSFRIGKVLEQAKHRALKELEQKHQAGEIYNLEREIQELTKYYDTVINIFVNSPYRVQKAANQFSIVVSQNPQDVAMMSTDRSWTSCMELGKGSHHENVFCEVEKGGLVAYLIHANDTNIQNPLARIHIRRFTNRQGQSVAISEDSVYGNEVTGFLDAVKGWLTEKQGDITPGWHQLQGGEYSDTFSEEMLVAPTKQEDVIKWFMSEDPEAQYSTWKVEDEMYEALKEYYQINGYDEDDVPEDLTQEFNTKEEAEKYLEVAETSEQGDQYREILGTDYNIEWNESNEEGEWAYPRLTLREKVTDNREGMRREAVKIIINAPKGTYSEDILGQVKRYILGKNHSLATSFVKKYTELLTEDEIKNLDTSSNLEFIKSLPEEQQLPYKAEWQQTIIDTVDNLLSQNIQDAYKDDEFSTHPDSIQYKAAVEFKDQVLDPIQILFKDQIPEPIAQRLIQYANSLEEMGYTGPEKLPKEIIRGRDTTSDHINNIRSSIVHTLFMCGADTPSVQRFYESLLPLWDTSSLAYPRSNYSIIGIDVLGHAIASLGENGKQFIPAMYEQLQQAKAKKEGVDKSIRTMSPGTYEQLVEGWDKYIEKMLYIIDSLESGTGRSDKYKFFKARRKIKTGTNWYKQASKEDKIKRWIKDHTDDQAGVWTRGCDVFVSIGDWAGRDIVDDLEHSIGQDVEWDYEVGSPGFDWVKVQ